MGTVKIIECPRDAWQGVPRQIPTERKVEYLRVLIAAGFGHIDAVSFVSPKAVPQMADSEDVLAQLTPTADVEIIGIVVNKRGAERAIATGKVTTLGFPCSISPTFLLRNQNQTPEENVAALRTITARAGDARLGVVVYVSMAFGNPYGDGWSERQLVGLIRQIAELRVSAISLADTVGVADASLISRIVAAAVSACGNAEIGVHLHSTRAQAALKILAAYDAGCRRFDSAVGGLGGCPFAQNDLVGNIPTEEVIRALESRGAKLGLDLTAVATLNSAIAETFSSSSQD